MKVTVHNEFLKRPHCCKFTTTSRSLVAMLHIDFPEVGASVICLKTRNRKRERKNSRQSTRVLFAALRSNSAR